MLLTIISTICPTIAPNIVSKPSPRKFPLGPIRQHIVDVKGSKFNCFVQERKKGKTGNRRPSNHELDVSGGKM